MSRVVTARFLRLGKPLRFLMVGGVIPGWRSYEEAVASGSPEPLAQVVHAKHRDAEQQAAHQHQQHHLPQCLLFKLPFKHVLRFYFALHFAAPLLRRLCLPASVVSA